MTRGLAARGARSARAQALLSAGLAAAGAACGAVSSSYSFTTGPTAAPRSAQAASSSAQAVALFVPPPAETGSAAASVTPTASSGGVIVQNNPLAAAALEAALLPYHRQYIPESKPVGGALGGVLSEGQTAQLEVPLRAGACYAALAFSPSISQFTVELVVPGGERPIGRSEQGVARLGALGCYQPRENSIAQLRVTAQRGAGPVVARVYER